MALEGIATGSLGTASMANTKTGELMIFPNRPDKVIIYQIGVEELHNNIFRIKK